MLRKHIVPMNTCNAIQADHQTENRFSLSHVKAYVTRKMTETRGEGYLDMVMKILIVIVLGAVILTVLNAAMPDLFQSLIDKISGEVAGVTMP